ncbi:MAG: S-adenosylmethionine synthetase N-terminal domain-containing protein, partial [Amphiplicatus sp.]
MARQNYLFTSESVSEGHPDKVCDRISDAVVDLFLAKDSVSRVACETLTTTNQIVVAGEVRCSKEIDPNEIEAAARAAVKDIGYEQDGVHWKNSTFQNFLHEQSADIAMGVDAAGNK